MRVHELAKELGVTSKELIAALDQMGVEGRTASSSVPDEAVSRLRASGKPAFEIAEFKEMFGLSRKLAIPLLEYLDGKKITRRVGDRREILRK